MDWSFGKFTLLPYKVSGLSSFNVTKKIYILLIIIITSHSKPGQSPDYKWSTKIVSDLSVNLPNPKNCNNNQSRFINKLDPEEMPVLEDPIITQHIYEEFNWDHMIVQIKPGFSHSCS